jgi:hypothetical protein
MSWAASRQITRNEDLTYCLLGVFDVNMPLLYGEGPKAFLRLQEEIIKTTHNLSIFAWKSSNPGGQEFRGVLARSPSEFASPPNLTSNNASAKWIGTLNSEFLVTNKGVKIASRLLCAEDYPDVYILPLEYKRSINSASSPQRGIYIRKVGADTFVRALPHSIHLNNPGFPCHRVAKRAIYIATEFPTNICRSIHDSRCFAIQFNFFGFDNIRQVKVHPESL